MVPAETFDLGLSQDERAGVDPEAAEHAREVGVRLHLVDRHGLVARGHGGLVELPVHEVSVDVAREDVACAGQRLGAVGGGHHERLALEDLADDFGRTRLATKCRSDQIRVARVILKALPVDRCDVTGLQVLDPVCNARVRCFGKNPHFRSPYALRLLANHIASRLFYCVNSALRLPELFGNAPNLGRFLGESIVPLG